MENPKRHILMVDDEIPNLNLFQKLFKKKYVVHTASSGSEGIDLMERNPVDLVICDQRMPEMTGVVLLEAVRRRHPRTSRIIMTAYLDVKAAIDAINRGQVSRYISKPWDNTELAALIEQELRFISYEEENERLALDIQRRNVELEKANIELESIDRIKTEFFSNVTHELKTPLLSSLGYLDLLLSGRGGEIGTGQKKYVEKAFDSIERLKDLVTDLVDFSAYERGLTTAVMSEFNILKVINAQTDIIEIQARQKDIAIRRSMPDKPLMVRADMSRIGQAVANLVGNAIKFTNQGGRISISVEEREGMARLDVADTGIGIAPEHLDRIFERFYQVDSSTTRKFGGAGIGLTIVKTVAELHKGQYGVTSTPGRGSNFWIAIPLAASGSSPDGRGFAPKYGRILVGVIDPDLDELRHAQNLLVAEGFNAIVGVTIDDAVHMASAHPADLMLVSLSAVRGDEAAEKLGMVKTGGKDFGLYFLRDAPENGSKLADQADA